MSWKDILKGSWDTGNVQGKSGPYWTGDGWANANTGKAIDLYWGRYAKSTLRLSKIPEYTINDKFREYKEENDISLPQKVSRKKIEEMTLEVLKDINRQLPPEHRINWNKVNYNQLYNHTVMYSYETYLGRR